MNENALFSPAAERNREPIAARLAELLPASGSVLEIASGSGQHAVHFAKAFPSLRWQPTDPDPDALRSISAWQEEAALPNLAPPLELDVTQSRWPVDSVQAIVAINMVHISPWEATEALLRGAAALLPDGAPLILYGPYILADRPTAPSNLAFDRSLRSRNPLWGVRALDKVTTAASGLGLARHAVYEMPANNFLIEFRKQAR